MNHRTFGSLSVSVIGLGCNNFGRRIDLDQTRAVIDAAFETGINFFDTADIYGGTRSEEFLGEILGERRKEIVLATKFGMEVSPEKKGAKPAYIRQAVEDSLRRLRTDYLDLYQLHTPDPETPIEETIETLQDLVRQGKVREIGCSNFSVEQLRQAKRAAGHGPAFVSVQNEYSLFHLAPEQDGVLQECLDEKIGFIPYFPLASGLLTGKYRKGAPAPTGTRIDPSSDRLNDSNFDRIERLTAYAEGKGHSLLDLAFGYLLGSGAVCSVIAGATRPEQIHANASAGSWSLSESEQAEVRELLNS